MKKAIAILLTALLMLTVFVSCEGDVEDLFGDNITITFNGNGSTSGQMAALKVARGKEVRLTANAYKKSDNEFTGWNTKADGSGDDYEDEEFVYFEEDTTLYAQWSSGVTITFDANDGSGTMDPVKVSAGVYKLPENGFTAPEGYAFVRWSETADGEVEYEVGDELEVANNITLHAIWAKVLTDSMTSWETGRYTIYDSLSYNYPSRPVVNGNVKLYLPDGKTLTTSQGITVEGENELIIDKVGTNGTGKLDAQYATDDCAAIGGTNGHAGGIITICGGTIDVQGKYGGAGIGGGNNGAGGTVTIYGGTVKAAGGANSTPDRAGAGIGGGAGGAGGTVTIYGGIVDVRGGSISSTVFGSGIGAGYGGTDVTINLNNLISFTKANYTDSWKYYDGTNMEKYALVPEPIVLDSLSTSWTSGNVYTLGNEDLEIASRITVTGSVGLLLPDGRKLTASKGITVTGSNSLTINGGTGQNAGILEATGDDNDEAAGIGGGYNGAGGTVTINGGTVTATGGKFAAGIGGGFQGDGGTVTINGGTVTATGGYNGAGIGGGYSGAGWTVTINNGTVTATGVSGGAGIGGGYYGAGGTVTISGGSVTANGVNNAVGIGRGYGSGSDGTLEIGDGVHVYQTGETTAYANGPLDNLTTRYQNMTVNTSH